MKEQLAKLRKLPVKQKKYILWGTVVVLGAIMVFFWVRSIGGRINEFEWTGGFDQREWPERNEVWSELDEIWSQWSIEDFFPEELEEALRTEPENNDLEVEENNIENEQNGEED